MTILIKQTFVNAWIANSQYNEHVGWNQNHCIHCNNWQVILRMGNDRVGSNRWDSRQTTKYFILFTSPKPKWTELITGKDNLSVVFPFRLPPYSVVSLTHVQWSYPKWISMQKASMYIHQWTKFWIPLDFGKISKETEFWSINFEILNFK